MCNIIRRNVPLRLLLQVCFTSVDDLLHDLDVVLRDRANSLSQSLSILQDGLPGIVSSCKELASEGIKFGMATGLGVEATTDGTLSATLLVEIFDEGFFRTVTVVVERLIYEIMEIEFRISM